MNKINILVFPAGTEIAFEIHNALKNSRFIKLYGATSVPCHANFVFENCINDVPFVEDPDLIDKLNEVVWKYDIDYIYPAHDSALLRLTREQGNIVGAQVITSPLETVEICRDKEKTYEFFADCDFLPKVYRSADEVDTYPVFVKPAVGQGGEGAQRADDKETLERVLSCGRKYVICEYLPGDEYTVDCFTDRYGALHYINQRTRDRIRSGIAVRSKFVDLSPEMWSIGHEINERLKFNGAWFFQIKKDANGECKLMEIAPRIAGTMGLSRNIGVNLPLLTLCNMREEDVKIITNRTDIVLDRAFISRFKQNIEYDKVYVDLDDTLISKGKVNPFLIAFLYQAKGKGKRLVLVSKHAFDIRSTLKVYHIDERLFDAIIKVDKFSGKKSDYVSSERAIFIDDSFYERKEVWLNCDIPVFGLEMVESLFDWCA